MKEFLTKALAKIRAIGDTYLKLWREHTEGMVYVHVCLLLVAFIWWLLWPVKVEPPKDFTEKQEAAKEEVINKTAQGDQNIQNGAEATNQAEKSVQRLQSVKKGISDKRKKVYETQKQVDTAGTTGGDNVTVRDYTDLCSRAVSLGVSCDPNK